MTVYQLHKRLTKAIADGDGRRPVVVHKTTFQHPLETDGCVLIDVEDTAIKNMPIIDDDGGIALDSRGREKTRDFFILSGGHAQDD